MSSKRKEENVAAAAKNVKKETRLNILDVLLDENNRDPIILEDLKGKRYSFEQIAVIPFKEKLYCVLKPIDKVEGVNDDEAIVFVVHEEKGKDPVLMVETDEAVAMQVFEEYYNLLDEVTGEGDGEGSGKAPAQPKKTTSSKTTATKSTTKSTSAKTTSSKSSATKATSAKSTSSKKSGTPKSGN